LMMNKPTGVLTSVGDRRGRPTVTDDLPTELRLFPVGRLDFQSRGLLLLTDDGELAMRLMHPRYGVEKEYHVVIDGQPEPATLRRLARALVIAGDGPAGSGKTTIGRMVAYALSFALVYTGLFYRAVTVEARRRGIAPDDVPALTSMIAAMVIEVSIASGADVKNLVSIN